MARRLSPFLTVYLLTVSLGLPLHKVYCACRGITDLSLFEPEHNCAHDEPVVEKPVKKISCCSSSEEKLCSLEAKGDHDCGDAETILAKFTADYLTSEDQDLVPSMAWNVAFAPLWVGPTTPLVLVPKMRPIRGPDPPPKLYGRALLLRQQLFLC